MDTGIDRRYLHWLISIHSETRRHCPPYRKTQKPFRPITLLEPITKLVTGAVARRLLLLFHTNSLLHHHQFGFVHGGSCEAPIEVVNGVYEYAIEHNEQLHVAFLDATSAFDTAQHPAPTAAFSSIGAGASFIRWIVRRTRGEARGGLCIPGCGPGNCTAKF